jgi:undecaprenyl diphosphate synthase
VLGEVNTLPLADRVAVQAIVKQTVEHDALTLNIAFNYGGRAEILRAVGHLIRDGVAPDDVSEEVFASYLYTRGQPEPDLVIRTAGEQRLSNFLIWQAAYAEYYFTPTLWPDFTRAEFEKALRAFGARDRTFGRAGEPAYAGAERPRD